MANLIILLARLLPASSPARESLFWRFWLCWRFLAWWCFAIVGHWLVREDALGKADVIVVLSGGLPFRAEAAAGVFKSGYAPAVWVSRPEGPQEELAALGIHFVGEEEYNREILVQQGVPDAAIRIFPDTIVNTQDEVEEISREMRRDEKHTVIIVTSPQHTRRVKALWRKLVGDDPRVIVRAAWGDPFDADHWWRTTSGCVGGGARIHGAAECLDGIAGEAAFAVVGGECG